MADTSDLPRLPRRHVLDLTDMPSPDARAGRLAGEISNTPTTWADWGRAGEGFARDLATAAPSAIYEAAIDPTLPKLTNAGAQTALTLGKPYQALGIGAVGLGSALADDLDLFGGEAVAGTKSKKAAAPEIAPAPEIPGLSPEEQAVFNAAWGQMNAPIGSIPKVARQSAKETVDGFMTRMGEKSAAAIRQKQQEYEGKVTDAVKARDQELARDTRFADTETGKWYQENATWLPFAAAFGGGLASRAFTGPGKELAGKAFKEYALPIFTGGTLSYGSQNAPEIYDFSVPPALNPEREAYSKYSFKLPEGHPDKESAKVYSDSLPQINPVKTAAVQSFKENAPARMMAAGLEGISLGKLGAGAAGLPGRLTNDAWSKAKGGSGKSSAGGHGPGSGPSGSPGPSPSGGPRGGSGKTPPVPPQTNGVAGSYVRALPEEVKNDLRKDFIATRATNANRPVPEKEGAKAIKGMLERDGYSVPVSAPRVKATNDALDQFYAANGRYPEPSEYPRVFNKGTLAVPGAVGLGALGYGMDEPPSEFADGGSVLPRLPKQGEPITVGPLHSDVPGRTDHLNISVPEGAFVVPADLVAFEGDGNSIAGLKALQQKFPRSNPKTARADGGRVPIAAAGGEFIVSPEDVMAIGGGDLNRGHAALDAWVVQRRKEGIQHLAKLPPPER
jgi:hypothetical protein